jgi:hypothetical protein
MMRTEEKFSTIQEHCTNVSLRSAAIAAIDGAQWRWFENELLCHEYYLSLELLGSNW